MNPFDLPPRTMPNLNLYRIINLVWKRNSISRIEVAEELSLTKSTITKIVTQLVSDGLLQEEPVGKPEGRGRPRVALRLNPSRGEVLGLELRTDGWSLVVVRLDGEVMLRQKEQRAWHAASLLRDVEAILEPWLRPRSVPVVAIGIAVPGIVDSRNGLLLRSNPLGLQSPLALASHLERRFHRPVVVENDANCGSWGELAFGPLTPSEPFLFLLCEDRRHRSEGANLGRVAAVGFGLVLGGRPWRGPNHSSGEFSSILKRDPSTSLQFDFEGEAMGHVFEDATLETRLIDELARHVGMLVNFLNLKAVYVSWPESGHGSWIIEAIQKRIQDNWLYPSVVDCRVQPPTGGVDAIAWGAAGLTLEQLWGESAFSDDQPRWK